MWYRSEAMISNMLTISFGTRTDTATDPLVEKALAMAMEFMDLTGNAPYLCLSLPLLIVVFRSLVEHRRLR